MNTFATVMASAVLLATPALADSVTTSETIQTQPGAPVMAPPVAEAPVQQRSIDTYSVKERDGSVKEMDKHTDETITPSGSARTTTKIER